MTVCFRQPWRLLSRGETTQQEDKMDTDCNSDYEDGSPDVSVEEEEEDEAPEERLTSSSLKKLNQNEEMKSKSDAMDTNQSEDSGLTWETSSSRCSTSQASETSATSGVYSMENYVDSSPGKAKCLMDEGKTAQKRTSNSPEQVPLSPNETIGPDGKRYDFPGGSVHIKAQERELDPADPQSWPLQVQPSKIKDYLVQITQEVVTSVPEEKENALMKKGELPLKGTVRARIQQITAVLEERNKKIFRRINQKDVPPPSEVIRKPREPPKIFSRQGISVSLRHIERDAPDKKNKKEILSYNLRHVQTNISKSGASVPYNRDEKRAQRSFLSETINNSNQKLPSLRSSDQAKKLDTKIHSPVRQTTIPEQASFSLSDWSDKTGQRDKPTLLPGTVTITTEKLSNHFVETEEQKMQDHSSLTTKGTGIAEESKTLPTQEATQFHSPIAAEPLSYPANDINNHSDSTVTVLSEPATQGMVYPDSAGDMQPIHEKSISPDVRNKDAESTIPTQMEVKNAALLHPTEETGKQGIPHYSPEASESVPELAESLLSVSDTKKEELEVGYSKKEDTQEQLAMLFQADSKPLHSLHLVKETDAGDSESVPDLTILSGTEIQEQSRTDLYKMAEEYSDLPQPLYFTGQEAEQKEEHLQSDLAEQAAQAQISVITSAEPEHPDMSQPRGNAEKETALLEASESFFPTHDAEKEETHQLSAAVARSENEHPVISEHIKAPQGLEPLELSHIGGKEVSLGSLVEAFNSSEQLPSVSSHLTETSEKQEAQPSPLIIARPLLEQPDSGLPCPAKQREEQNNLSFVPETVTVMPEASPLPTLAVQNAEVVEAEIQSLSPTDIPSEEIVHLSRESDLVKDRKATQLISPLSTESWNEASAPSQGEEKLEEHLHPCINEKLSLADKYEIHPTINEGEQEEKIPLPATMQSDLDHLVKSESRKQSMEQNSSLVEKIPLSPADQLDNKDFHPDKPITSLLHPDSVPSVPVLEKQEKQQTKAEQTFQQLSDTVLSEQSGILQLVDETEIKGTPIHLPETVQDSSQSAYLMETQEDQCVSTDRPALDSGYLSIPYNMAEAEKYDTTETETKHTVKQAIQAVSADLEADYQETELKGELEEKVPALGSGKHLDLSSPIPSTEEDLQSHRPVLPELKEDQPVSLEREKEDIKLHSLITPVSKLEQPIAGPETLRNENYSCDILNKVPNTSPIISPLVPDKIKDQEILTNPTVSLAPTTEQPNFISPLLEDRAKIEENEFHQFPETPQMVPKETRPLRTALHGEAREELLNSFTTTKTELEIQSSILEDMISEKVNEITPPSSVLTGQVSSNVELLYTLAEGEEDHPPSLLEEPKHIVVGELDMKDVQPHLFVTGQSEMTNQENKPQHTVTSELEDVSLSSSEEVRKQDTPLSLPSVEPSAPIHLELLYHKGENQERITLEVEHSKEHNAPLRLSILQQESEHLHLLQSANEPHMHGIQPYSSTVSQDSSTVTDMTGTLEHQGHPSKTTEGDSELPAFCSLGIENQNSNQIPPFITIKEEHEMSSQISAPSTSPASAEDKQQGTQTYPSEVANGIPEEPLSLAVFLLSEANAIHSSFPQTSKKEALETQSFEEAGLLTEEVGSATREPEHSTIHFKSEFLSGKLQEDITNRSCIQERTEDISDIPALPNSIPNELSSAVIPETMDDTHIYKQRSTVNSVPELPTDSAANKAIGISARDLSKTEGQKCLFNSEEILRESKNDSEGTLEDPEKYLQKERELKDPRKVREESILVPEPNQRKDTSDISESNEVVNIYASLLSPLSDKKEDAHVLKSLEYLETVSSLKTRPLSYSADVAVDHEPSVCKRSGKSLKADKLENRGNESKELVDEKGVKENAEDKEEISILPKSKGILKNIGKEYIENYALIDDTSFTQTGKEKSVKEVQRQFDVTKKNLEEETCLAASSENILDFSLLQRNLDEASHAMGKKENIMATQEGTFKLSNENKVIGVIKETDKDTEGELNQVGAHSEKDILSQSSLIPLPDTAVSPTLSFLYSDLHKEVVEASKEDSHECSTSEESGSTDVPLPARHNAPDDGTGIFLEKDIPEDYTPNNLEESQKEHVLKDQPVDELAVNQTNISGTVCEINKEHNEFVHILTESYGQTEILAPREMVENLGDKLTEEPVEVVSDIKVGICQPTHAIPFGGRLYGSGASNDDDSQREESIPEERGQVLPEETSDEESSPILDYAATVYQNETPVQQDPKDICFAVGQNQQPEKTMHKMDNGDIKKSSEISHQSLEASCHVNTHWHTEEQQPEDKLIPSLEPVSQSTIALEHEHVSYWDTEQQTFGENINHDLDELDTEIADQLTPEAKTEKPFGEIDFSLLSHDFDTHPLYSIKEEEYSDIEEDLAELMDYEMVTQDDVFQAETSSEMTGEELLFDDRKTSDRISNTYEFVNEEEVSTYAEEDNFELMDPDKLLRNIPKDEILQKEIDEAQFDTYCHQCKCPISADDKLSGEHKQHEVTDLDTAVTVLKGQLDSYLDVLQERSLKIEGFVSEIEALFNSLEENCKEKEKLLEEQNESIVKMVIGHHDRKAESFEEERTQKMEYLYEQMVNFQEYVDTAKETLEAIIKEVEDMDDFVFLRSSEEINKRLLSAVENILTLEKVPESFSQFEHYASGTANGDQTLKHMPVPQTPKLQPQDPNSATSTSITVYWTVNEDDVIDFFQVYCMEEYPGSKEQSGLVEEYRVTVKESNCILEDLEPGHSYSVWVMAVNYTGCSFPSHKSTFRTAPPTPVLKAEECTVCWDTAIIRWRSSNPEATDSFTLEYCRQYSPEGEGLRSLAGIKRPEMKVHLESNVNYFFYVRAVNVFGTSEQSEAALISTKGTRFHIMKGTADPTLQVSPNGTMLCLPEDKKGSSISPVLGELLPAQGWHYWEITVSACAAFKVGICYSSLPQDNILGQNNTSWCLHRSSIESFIYEVLHSGEMSNVIVTEQPARIGILLDYNAGRLSFFNAERGQVLSTIRHRFSHPAHPAFVLEQPGVLNLHTGMELPEFVKQS
ncbi:LOW QUALITY PROTEIN: cardiomyopathy-associated protein 5 [Sceloporus undulatus]|uniref:LOW QUALITY PROTEIN: cardiomyopathy-associated protein 5 n=1 Tax=Sceloporus undulatus TaxID=8520 RepID=UPI001C4CC3DD|nr:LOW QUALITY PROTEIN: cardiomyopathy-associated protein 5 [Sceloporus undulatus]